MAWASAERVRVVELLPPVGDRRRSPHVDVIAAWVVLGGVHDAAVDLVISQVRLSHSHPSRELTSVIRLSFRQPGPHVAVGPPVAPPGLVPGLVDLGVDEVVAVKPLVLRERLPPLPGCGGGGFAFNLEEKFQRVPSFPIARLVFLSSRSLGAVVEKRLLLQVADVDGPRFLHSPALAFKRTPQRSC